MTTQFWVSFTGLLTEDDDSPLVLSCESNQTFLRETTAALIEDGRVSQGATFAMADGRIQISVVVDAVTKVAALETARVVFIDAIDRAGGGSNLPDGWDRWRAHALDALVDGAETQIIPLAA